MAKQYYQLIQGNSAKYWHIELTGNSFTTCYGRIGTAGRTTTKSFKDHKAAKAACQKMIDDKLSEGYQKVTARQAAEHTGASGVTKKSAATKTAKKHATKKTAGSGLTPLLKKLKRHARGADANSIGELLKSKSPQVDNAQLLHWAARSGAPEVIRLLVEHGAEVNRVTSQGSALCSAASEDRADSAETLLELGADPGLKHPENSHKEWRGMNALDVARYWKARKVIRVLEAAGRGGKTKPHGNKKTTSVGASWKRIEKWLADNNDADRLESFGKPATGDQIAKLEKTLGVKLPADVKQSYKIHDGQSYQSSLIESPWEGSYYMLSVKGIQQEWKTWKSLVDIDEFEGQSSSPEKGIRGDQWYNLKWIPILSNGGGDSYCVDLAPAPEGQCGQIISMNHESSERTVIAASLTELLSRLADDLEAGVMVYED